MTYVILKFDDFVGLSPGFERLVEICEEKNIKGSFGVITGKLKKNRKLKKLHNSGLIEFWNHGSKHCRMNNLTVGQQLDLLIKAQEEGLEKIGIEFKTFGAPFNWINSDTLNALRKIPEINVLFMHINPLAHLVNVPTDKFILPVAAHMMGCRLGDFSLFQKNFKEIKMEVLVLQAHPRNWTSKELDEYLKIIDFLKKQDCKFVTPHEYYLIRGVNDD